MENSSDSDMGRRPKLKSDEFSDLTPLLIEKTSLLCLKPLNRCGTFWEPDPGGQLTVSSSVPSLRTLR